MEKSIKYELIPKQDFHKINEFEIYNLVKTYEDSLESLYNYIKKMNLVYNINDDEEIYRMCQKCMMSLWKDFLRVDSEGDKFIVISREYIDNKPCKIVGIARFTKNKNTMGKWLLEGIEVIKRFRHKGVGKKILEYGYDHIKKCNDKRLYSNVKNDNKESIEFHKRLGFSKIKEEATDSLGITYKDASTYMIEIN